MSLLLLALGGYLAVGKINEIILPKNSNTIWQLKIYSKVRTLLTVHKKRSRCKVPNAVLVSPYRQKLIKVNNEATEITPMEATLVPLLFTLNKHVL